MSYPLLNVFLTTMWLFACVLWIFLLVRITGGIGAGRRCLAAGQPDPFLPGNTWLA